MMIEKEDTWSFLYASKGCIGKFRHESTNLLSHMKIINNNFFY